MNPIFKADLYRYYGDKGESIKSKLFRPKELKYLALLRKCSACKFKPLQLLYRIRLFRLSQKTQLQIPYKTKIGKGFYIGHTGRIIINPRSVIGENVNIATGVTIGQENRGKRAGCPTIKNNCWIGTNAVIVGKIEIGNDVLIAPLSYVNFDVPDHSIVIGNPGRIIPKEYATEHYINYTV